MYIPYLISSENIANNVFINSSAAYIIGSTCGHALSLSLGSSRCIQCSENWHQDLIGITVAAFIAGIALVIFMLALNMTVAVGTFNGILFYANIVAANADAYFLPFTTPDFTTVLISWLNLDIGFDFCFYVKNDGSAAVYKVLIWVAFPICVIIIVIIVIVASESSSKFAKIVSTCLWFK